MSETATIPLAPGAVPLLGHLPRLARDPLTYLDTLSAYGGLLTLKLGGKKMVVVCDPMLTHQVLVADDVYDKGGPFFEAAEKLMPTAMGFAPHRKHRRLRKLMQPSFTRGRLSGYGEIMTDEITGAMAKWRDGQELDVVPELMAVTGRVLTATIFSSSVSEETLREIMADSLELTRGLLVDTALPAPFGWLTPGYGRYRKAVARLRETTQRLITERKAEGNALEHGDLLSALLAGDSEDGDAFSDSELVDQLSFMLVAGTETTAQTVSWVLYELSRRPEVQAQLQREVDEVLGGRPATYDDVPQLAVANRLLSEVLRLYSPSWLFTRVTTADTELGGHKIPAGTDVLYSPYIINREPKAHEQARSFDPDRWQPERAECMHKEGYIPFGTGARKCIGDQFSLVESALILATIAAKWNLEPVPGNQLRTSRKIVNTPAGLKLRVAARAR
ncbi:cytochrome P450 [Actinospica sp.]|uniref:cytochrome P450 n=1 Tax=Actinospica sp. TaxID=1872142 RepID=UPI002C5C2A2E|nr:cytochrome P450 [Actinospica sp.]HWG25252.1 cytochrome P450 [Actinospica sp.]